MSETKTYSYSTEIKGDDAAAAGQISGHAYFTVTETTVTRPVEYTYNYNYTIEKTTTTEATPESSAEKTPNEPAPASFDIANISCKDYAIDHTYLRSIEGILRLITIPVAVLYLVLTLIGYLTAGAWVSFFFGIGWITYAVGTIVIEVCVPRFFVHRLVDGIVTTIWAVLWGVAAIVAIAAAAVASSVVIGISVIFAVANTALIAVNAFFAFRTWKTYEGGRKGSVAIFII